VAKLLGEVPHSFLAVVLAGGKSSRMGQDKASLYSPKLQRTLIEQSVKILSQLNDCKVVISSNVYPGAIKDLIPDCGPLSGIHGLLSYAQEQSHIHGLLFIPVDMPNLAAKQLQSLVLFAQQNDSAAFITKSFLPCYLPLNNKVLSIVSEQLESNDWSIRRLLDKLAARSLTLQDTEQLININNPRDWQQHCQ